MEKILLGVNIVHILIRKHTKQVTNKKIRFVSKIILVFTPIIFEILFVLSTIKNQYKLHRKYDFYFWNDVAHVIKIKVNNILFLF